MKSVIAAAVILTTGIQFAEAAPIVKIDTNPLNDNVTATVFIPGNGVGFYYTCEKGGRESLFASFDEYIGIYEGTVKYRFDKQPAKQHNYYHGADTMAPFPLDELHNLASASSVYIEAASYGSGSGTIDLAGSKAALYKAYDACDNW